MSSYRKVIKGLGSYIQVRRLREIAYEKNLNIGVMKVAWFPWGSTYGVRLASLDHGEFDAQDLEDIFTEVLSGEWR